MNPEELENKIEELSSKVEEQDEKIEELQNKPVILDRYLDNQSREIIKETISDRILDITWDDYFYYQTFFESLDGWNLTDSSGGSSNTNRLGVHLVTGASTNDESSIDKEPVYQNVLSFDQESRFSTAFFVTGVSDVEGFLGIGEVNNGATGNHYGFFFENSTLKGSCADGSTQSTIDLVTISTNHPSSIDPIYYIEAHLYPGHKIEFFVKTDAGNIINKGIITTNLPSGRMFEWLGARIKTTTTSSIELRFGHMEYVQIREGR